MRNRFFAICLAAFLPSGSFGQDAAVVAAFDAVDEKQWDTAYGLAGQDYLAHDLITWLRLRQGEGTFDEYMAFAAAHADWPGLDGMREEGEAVIDDTTPPSFVLEWMSGVDPETGTGGLRQALALRATGQDAMAREVIRDVWSKYGLTEEEHDAILAAFGPELADLHMVRADRMLWRWKADDAKRMLPLLPDDQRALVAARIALMTKASDWEAKLTAVPRALLNDTGLAYDRFSFLADRGDYTAAIAILNDRTGDPALLSQPFRWSGWRRSLARWEMRQGRYDSAYRLASLHHLTKEDGENWADLEWLAGYVALRFMNRPDLALGHFNTLHTSVDGAISAGRAGYWLGRTYEAMGNAENARASYQEAAQNQTAYYGLLAAEKLGLTLDASLVGTEDFPDFATSALASNEKVRAGLYLLDGNQRAGAVLFFADLGRTLSRSELGTLGEELVRRNEPFFALIIGKSAAARGIVIPGLLFPLHDLRSMDLPVAPELALSIARRESEFNPVVGSSVGALGLMQLMPGTAEDVAKELGLSYSRGRLTADWAYNATLGSQYLANLEDRFGPTPVMIAAAYNAGFTRPEQWMAERGDPRTGAADVVDWVEMIPFNETRNYVQRVSESIPIYRARLSGQVGPVRFTDVLIGEMPVRRPLARPWEGPVPITASGLAPAATPSPQARP